MRLVRRYGGRPLLYLGLSFSGTYVTWHSVSGRDDRGLSSSGRPGQYNEHGHLVSMAGKHTWMRSKTRTFGSVSGAHGG
jgi:hypothetical protein